MIDIHEFFNEKIGGSDKADDALKWSEAYRNTVEADSMEFQNVQKNDTELKKERLKTVGVIVTAVGAVIAVGIKIFGELEFQDRDMRFEESGHYVNHKRHKM